MRPAPEWRHRARVFAQVTFETSAGQQAGVFAVAGDQHLRAGFGIGGPAGADHGGEHQGLIRGARAFKQGQKAME